MKVLKNDFFGYFPWMIFAVFTISILGCSGNGGTGTEETEEVTFELQDFPVNSPLYTYEDSASLKEAMATFQLEPGLRIELIAAEPLVVDPSAIAFDGNGVMYVAENRGYPDPVDGSEAPPQGKIARLEDRDGDGRYDHRTDFVTDLTYPNGVMPWKGGIFVTCAPDIFYFKDTDGDGVADVKEVVLTGFNASRTAQIRTSHPILGDDGWIYLTSGLNGGEVVSPKHPERPPVVFTASDGRFHPETLEFQTTGGRSQFGLAFDPYGRRFGSSNRHPVQQIVMEPRYLKRNPHLLFNETIENVAKAEAEATVFPISNAVTTADFIPNLMGRSHKGTFTSACGLVIYNGTALGHSHRGNVFICEPAQNLVQRQVLEEEGVTFRSELPYEDREFLASTDTWFNPVFLTHGPGGALYLADMYRKVIDHPSYVPEEARGRLDFESGKTKGRIYRIVNKDYKNDKNRQQPGLSSSTNVERLVETLGSPEEWERKTAFRLLLEEKKTEAAPLLKELAEGAEHPESRAKALWLLDALQALEVSTLEKAIADAHAGVREQAVLIMGQMPEKHPELLKSLVAASKDESQRVRFVSALVLGSSDAPEVVSALAEVAAKDGADSWSRAAVLSGIGSRLPEFLTEFRAAKDASPTAFAAMMKDLGNLFGNGATLADNRELFRDILKEDDGIDWRMSTTLGLLEGVSAGNKLKASSSGWFRALLGDQANTAELEALDKFLNKTEEIALDEAEEIRNRVVATSLLGYADFEKSGDALRQLLDAKRPPEVRLEAVAAVSRLGDVRGGALLTGEKEWSSYTPRVKSAVIAALVSKPDFVRLMFSAIEKGIIAPAEIPSINRQRLIKSNNQEIAKQAGVLFNELEGGGRMEVYEAYKDVLDIAGDPAPGKSVFQTACSACHTYAGEGGVVGPDLSGINNQPADAILLHTLVPNYEVLPAYQAIAVETSDGRSISGWILAETDNSMTLRTAFGTEESVLRSNIVSLNNSGLSLMPDGLEQTMTKEDLANLIAYLKSGG